MSKIFVLVANEGRYDDFTRRNVKAFFSKEKAEDVFEKAREHSEKQNALWNSSLEEHNNLSMQEKHKHQLHQAQPSSFDEYFSDIHNTNYEIEELELED